MPLLAHMGAWGRRHLPVTHELSVRAQLLEEGGPALWDDFMDELRTSISARRPSPARAYRNDFGPPMKPRSPRR